MLNFFRNIMNTIAVKILMVLMILAFALWGIGDLLKAKDNKNYVFKINDYSCSEQEWSGVLNQQINYISNNMGRQLTKEEVLDGGLYVSILNKLIDRRLILEEAKNLGLLISDSIIQKYILTYPIFQNKEEKFDKEIFQKFLSDQNLNEERFIDLMRDEIVYETMLNSIGSNMLLAPQLVRQLMISEQSTKSLTAFELERANYMVKAEATQQELEQTLTKYKSKFMAPEIRDITYISFTQKDVIKDDITVTDAELQEFYSSRKFMFERPERRSVFHIVAKTKEAASSARAALTVGESFATVMKKYGDSQTEYKMPEVMQSSLESEVASAIFSLQGKDLSEPVKTAMGFHIFQVNELFPADVIPFNEVKTNLTAQLHGEKLFEKLSAFTRKLNEEIAGGASLDALVEKYNLKKSTIHKLKADVTPNKDITTSPNFIQVAFSSNAKSVSSVSPASENVYFALSVDSITPKRQLELSEVKKELTDLWSYETTSKKMYTASQELKVNLAQDKTTNIPFKKYNVEINNSYKGDLPVEILRSLAKLKQNDFSDAIPMQNGNYIFVKMGPTSYPDQNKFPDLTKLVQPNQSQGQAIVMQYIQHLRGKYSIDINKKYLDGME